jgi:hypothetical protein
MVIVWPSCHVTFFVFHTTWPVVWSSATSEPSSWATKTLPSPRATPRASQPQQTVAFDWFVSEWYVHRCAPVVASSAKTSSLPVTT